MNLSENLLQAVQLLERHQNFIFTNQYNLLSDFGAAEFWKITAADFAGPYLTITWLDNTDRTHKMQIPIFDYQNWRAKNNG